MFSAINRISSFLRNAVSHTTTGTEQYDEQQNDLSAATPSKSAIATTDVSAFTPATTATTTTAHTAFPSPSFVTPAPSLHAEIHPHLPADLSSPPDISGGHRLSFSAALPVQQNSTISEAPAAAVADGYNSAMDGVASAIPAASRPTKRNHDVVTDANSRSSTADVNVAADGKSNNTIPTDAHIAAPPAKRRRKSGQCIHISAAPTQSIFNFKPDLNATNAAPLFRANKRAVAKPKVQLHTSTSAPPAFVPSVHSVFVNGSDGAVPVLQQQPAMAYTSSVDADAEMIDTDVQMRSESPAPTPPTAAAPVFPAPASFAIHTLTNGNNSHTNSPTSQLHRPLRQMQVDTDPSSAPFHSLSLSDQPLQSTNNPFTLDRENRDRLTERKAERSAQTREANARVREQRKAEAAAAATAVADDDRRNGHNRIDIKNHRKAAWVPLNAAALKRSRPPVPTFADSSASIAQQQQQPPLHPYPQQASVFSAPAYSNGPTTINNDPNGSIFSSENSVPSRMRTREPITSASLASTTAAAVLRAERDRQKQAELKQAREEAQQLKRERQEQQRQQQEQLRQQREAEEMRRTQEEQQRQQQQEQLRQQQQAAAAAAATAAAAASAPAPAPVQPLRRSARFSNSPAPSPPPDAPMNTSTDTNTSAPLSSSAAASTASIVGVATTTPAPTKNRFTTPPLSANDTPIAAATQRTRMPTRSSLGRNNANVNSATNAAGTSASTSSDAAAAIAARKAAEARAAAERVQARQQAQREAEAAAAAAAREKEEWKDRVARNVSTRARGKNYLQLLQEFAPAIRSELTATNSRGLDYNALRKAMRKAMAKYHPDKHMYSPVKNKLEAEEVFVILKKAYDELTALCR